MVSMVVTQRHHHQHGEERRSKSTYGVSNVEDDQLHQAAGVEQGSQGNGISPGLPGPAGRERGAAHFAKDRGQEDQPPPKATWLYR